MKSTYVYLVLGHRSFFTGQICVVEVPSTATFITTYRDMAFEKACEKFGVSKDEASILDWSYWGEDVTFIK